MRSIMAMVRPRRNDSAALYAALVAEARQRGWYLDGGVPDTLDGRFSVLSTVVAIAILRLESGGEEAVRSSVSLTESFIADMDVQMREEGFSDTSLGKQVRHMVGALATKVDRWRTTIAADGSWDESVAASIERGDHATEASSTFAAESLRRLHESLGGASDAAVIAGKFR
ncbi:ubiquinol-cytochrome C chaperone [Sphingomonas rhizophila]|uniref:Ubiquinol-cytochrome C chaperone n=1 Tax=Sphingomonas rhizophila TaxID=2071607 RepID=A0A7G9SAP1_9SPHN|nr:ubiquinol-cytochrome C chaperone family protein [Sphingomonas rhizophila]QNN64916.1 ubiquinol-cytochrome C chaperone [Sphingomonas rhizophila]